MSRVLSRHAGILLTPQQWAAVTANAAAVAEALEGGVAEFSVVLGDMRQLRVREVGEKLTVDIREFYDKDGTPAPGKKGACARQTCPSISLCGRAVAWCEVMF